MQTELVIPLCRFLPLWAVTAVLPPLMRSVCQSQRHREPLAFLLQSGGGGGEEALIFPLTASKQGRRGGAPVDQWGCLKWPPPLTSVCLPPAASHSSSSQLSVIRIQRFTWLSKKNVATEFREHF